MHSNRFIERGLGFGVTSAVITTLGLIVGLNSVTHSLGVVIGGILVIAIADAFSDALGMHVSEESQERSTSKNIWTATIITFLSKFLLASTFIIPFLSLELKTAVYMSIVWGFFVMVFYNYRLAKRRKLNPLPIISEHILIAIIVIIITHYLGYIVQFFTQ